MATKHHLKKKALENINLSITKGEFIGIIGKNWFGQIYFGSADERAFGAADR